MFSIAAESAATHYESASRFPDLQNVLMGRNRDLTIQYHNPTRFSSAARFLSGGIIS